VPKGFDLEVLQVGQTGNLRDGTLRHERMLNHAEFDAAEVSLSSYVMAKARGLPFTAIPVFPRRLFSQSQMFVNGAAGIEGPRDLAGRRVGLQSFQTTLAVLAKGDLAHEYGVDLSAIRWLVKDTETIEFTPRRDFSVGRLAANADLSALLAHGDIDALFYSRTPVAPAGTIAPLFADAASEEAGYVRKNGYWPIMHLVAICADVVSAAPDVPRRLYDVFGDAKRAFAEYVRDPNWSHVPWFGEAVAQQQRFAGNDPWPLGLARNRANLQRFIGYSFDQGLIDRAFDAEELFHPSVRDT
jgi:4,5-dihydroxyphthalate decarboxylase